MNKSELTFSQSTLLIILWLAKAASVNVAAPSRIYGCPTRCGDVDIAYPFGIGANCAANDWFTITCNNTSYPPKPFISSINLEVLGIYPQTSTVRFKSPVFSNSNCPNRTNPGPDHLNLSSSPFSFPESINYFTAMGCDMIALLTQDHRNIGGCASICNDGEESLPKRSRLSIYECSGIRCCQISLPHPLKYVNVSLGSIKGDRDDATGSCKYAFITDQMYVSTTQMLVKEDYYLPATLEWEMYNYTSCEDACGYNTFCTSKTNGSQPFQCLCLPGYGGNPYLDQGCKSDYEPCNNANSSVEGSNNCNIKKSFRVKAIFIGLGTSFGTLILLIGAWRLYKVIKRRKKIMLKAKFFKQNGGLLLQQQLSSGEGNVEKTKLITSKELEKATDQYNKNRVLGQGGQGTVYKGMLADGRIVAVKKSKIEDESKVGQFINEVVILSQINHRNVVKLLGCCLETEVPLLVYEFIPNGTLSQLIHNQQIQEFPFAWEMRLQIATEIAGALSYLHSAASIPIYHRDIKSTNILLDEKYRAKVADFGTSKSIALDKTHLTTLVQGTFGYLDPEYFHTSQFTDKSDVYSFGVVLVELLTGQKPITSARSEEVISLAMYFIVSMKRNSLNDILDARIVMESRKEEIRAVANLARRCLNLNGRNRPTMKEVEIELEGIKKSQGGGNIIHQSFEKVEYDPADLTAPWDSASTSTSDARPVLQTW